MGELPHFRTAVADSINPTFRNTSQKSPRSIRTSFRRRSKEIQQLRQQLDEARDQLSQQAAAPKPEAAPTPAPEAPRI